MQPLELPDPKRFKFKLKSKCKYTLARRFCEAAIVLGNMLQTVAIPLIKKAISIFE